MMRTANLWTDCISMLFALPVFGLLCIRATADFLFARGWRHLRWGVHES
jgi:hypothetical protein